MRITKSELENRVKRIAKDTKLTLYIEYAYGKPRVYICNRELSPRLSSKELDIWLDGFEAMVDIIQSYNQRPSGEDSFSRILLRQGR